MHAAALVVRRADRRKAGVSGFDAGWDRALVVAVDALAPLVPLLRFQAQGGDGAGVQPG